MSRTVLRLLSLWAFAALIALMTLQALPATGPGLDELGAPAATGWLVHVTLLCLFLDALANRLPRVVALLPLIAYGGYAVTYWRQGAHIEERSQQLKAGNPGKVLDFDPQAYSLVMDRAAEFVATHAIPVAYKLDASYRPETYQSFRLASRELATQAALDAKTEVQLFAVFMGGAKLDSLRELRIPERPANRIITVATRVDPGAGWADWNLGAEITELILDGKTIGTFKSGYVLRLPIVPKLAIGCRRAAKGERRCYTELAFDPQPIDSAPSSVDPARFDDPVSVMLGVRKLTERELRAVSGFNRPLVSPATPRAAATRDRPAAIVTLQSVLNGQPADEPVATAVDALVRDPESLAPFASAIVNRLVELNRPDKVSDPDQREPASILAGAAAALPAADFTRVAETLRDVVRRADAWREYPALYLRMADLGPGMFSFFRDRFLSADTSREERLLAALAICRIGLADGELTAALKTQFSNHDAAAPHAAELSTALFVALLKLGQTDYLKSNARADSPPLQSWYDAMLAGDGDAPVGPNNCLSWDWPWPESLPPALSPRLRWAKGRWVSEGGG